MHICNHLSVLLHFVHLSFSNLLCTSTRPSLAGNRRVFCLTSQLKLGVLLQFPLLKKKEPCLFSIYLWHAAHRLHVRRRERFFTAGGSGSLRSTSQRLSDFQSLSWILHLQPSERGGGSGGAAGSAGWVVIDVWPRCCVGLAHSNEYASTYKTCTHIYMHLCFMHQCRERHSIYSRMFHISLNNTSTCQHSSPTCDLIFQRWSRPSCLPHHLSFSFPSFPSSLTPSSFIYHS